MLKNTLIFLLTFFTLFPLQAQENEEPILWSARWSNDGKWVAVGSDDGVLIIYETKDFDLFEKFEFDGSILRLEWHPTKNKLAVAATNKSACIIDFDSRTRLPLSGSELGFRGVAWSQDGKYLAGAELDSTVVIWRETGEMLHRITKENSYSYVAIDWDTQNNEVIGLSNKVRKYNLDGQLLDTLSHRSEQILMLCVQWHPSGTFYALGDYGNPDLDQSPILQFRNRQNELIFSTNIHNAEIRNLRWNKKGNRLATASDGLRIFSKKGKLLYTGTTSDKLWGIDWSPDGKYIVTSSETGEVIIWNKKAEKIQILTW